MTNKLCQTPPKYAPAAPCKLTFNLESGVPVTCDWDTTVPILVFLGFSVLDLRAMYATYGTYGIVEFNVPLNTV